MSLKYILLSKIIYGPFFNIFVYWTKAILGNNMMSQLYILKAFFGIVLIILWHNIVRCLIQTSNQIPERAGVKQLWSMDCSLIWPIVTLGGSLAIFFTRSKQVYTWPFDDNHHFQYFAWDSLNLNGTYKFSVWKFSFIKLILNWKVINYT